MIKYIKEKRGSVTLEAAVVSVVVILAVVMLLYMSFILYQQVKMQAIVNEAAERGAMVYSNTARDMETGKLDEANFKNWNPYWRLIGDGRGDKTNKITDYINSKINNNDVLEKTSNVNVGVNIEGTVYKKIVVDANCKYKIPLGGVFEMFGQSNPYEITAHAESLIMDPAELVRNTDLGIDILRKVDSDVTGGKGQKFLEKISTGFQKVLNFFK